MNGPASPVYPVTMTPGRSDRARRRVERWAIPVIVCGIAVALWLVTQCPADMDALRARWGDPAPGQRPSWIMAWGDQVVGPLEYDAEVLGSRAMASWLEGPAMWATLLFPLALGGAWLHLRRARYLYPRAPDEIRFFPDRMELDSDGATLTWPLGERGRTRHFLLYRHGDGVLGVVPGPSLWKLADAEGMPLAGAAAFVSDACSRAASIREEVRPARVMFQSLWVSLTMGIPLIALFFGLAMAAGSRPVIPAAAVHLFGTENRGVEYDWRGAFPFLRPGLDAETMLFGRVNDLAEYRFILERYLEGGGDDITFRLEGAILDLGERRPRVGYARLRPDGYGIWDARLLFAMGRDRDARAVMLELGSLSESGAGIYAAMAALQGGAADDDVLGQLGPAPQGSAVVPQGLDRALRMACGEPVPRWSRGQEIRLREWVDLVRAAPFDARPLTPYMLARRADAHAAAAITLAATGHPDEGTVMWEQAEFACGVNRTPGLLDPYRALWFRTVLAQAGAYTAGEPVDGEGAPARMLESAPSREAQ